MFVLGRPARPASVFNYIGIVTEIMRFSQSRLDANMGGKSHRKERAQVMASKEWIECRVLERRRTRTPSEDELAIAERERRPALLRCPRSTVAEIGASRGLSRSN